MWEGRYFLPLVSLFSTTIRKGGGTSPSLGFLLDEGGMANPIRNAVASMEPKRGMATAKKKAEISVSAYAEKKGGRA